MRAGIRPGLERDRGRARAVGRTDRGGDGTLSLKVQPATHSRPIAYVVYGTAAGAPWPDPVSAVPIALVDPASESQPGAALTLRSVAPGATLCVAAVYASGAIGALSVPVPG